MKLGYEAQSRLIAEITDDFDRRVIGLVADQTKVPRRSGNKGNCLALQRDSSLTPLSLEFERWRAFKALLNLVRVRIYQDSIALTPAIIVATQYQDLIRIECSHASVASSFELYRFILTAKCTHYILPPQQVGCQIQHFNRVVELIRPIAVLSAESVQLVP